MSPAYNPATGWFYLAVKEGCGINYKGKQEFRPGGFSYMATGYVESPQEPWQMYVRALDPLSGEMRWEHTQVNSKHYGAGLVSTAGGLIFAGDDQGFLTALDARSGEPLWHFNTGSQIKSSPMTYMVKGRQYVAVAAGANVVAFRLPEDPSSDPK